VKVEIWSDVLCPWCGLGNHRLDQAVQRFEHGEQIEVVHRSFQLDPSRPSGTTLTTRQMLAKKYGMNDAQAEAGARQIEALAEQDGLAPYIVLDNTIGNTGLAHEFLAYASTQGKHAEAWRHMFRAYFGQARPIFDVDALLDLAGELGLDRDSTRQALQEHRFRQQVEDDARHAQRLGASGVPFTVVDGRYAISGAQDTGTLLRLLEQAWDETHQPVSLTEDATGACGPDGCALSVDHPARA